MKRNVLVLVFLMASIAFASSAWAATVTPGEGGGDAAAGCFCQVVVGGAIQCITDDLLCGTTACPVGNECGEGEFCVIGANTDCGFCVGGANDGDACDVSTSSQCALPGICVSGNYCKAQQPQCNDGGNCTATSDFLNIPLPKVVLCPNNIPTLSQWGLILFGMLLLTMMFLTIRRRGLPTHLAASVLVLGAVGLAVATASYAQIQSERVCGESDIAVEFVKDILNT